MDDTRRVDEIDLGILRALQENARQSTAEIARRIDLAASAVHERIRKLEARGVLRGYSADIDPVAVDLGLLAFVFVRSSDRVGALGTAEELASFPEVLEVHHVAGEDCFLLKVRAQTPQDLARLLREKLGKVAAVTSSHTTIALETVKETSRLSLPGSAPP